MIINFLIILIGIYLVYAVSIQLVLAISAYFSKKEDQIQTGDQKRFAVLFPAYQEDQVIVASVKKLLAQQYSSEAFKVFVIADGLLQDTIDRLQKLSIKVIEVDFEQSTKTKALRAAMAQIPSDHFDAVVILDADNLAEENFLHVSNSYLNKGYKAIQGQRKAANLDTPFAIWDAIAEAINHHIFCKGAFALKLSARLMGSGMVFDLELFRQLINEVEAVGGFDKALEIELVKQNIRIAYAEEAIVYDEKVRSGAVYMNQRSRWIAAQYVYLRRYYLEGINALFQSEKDDLLYKVTLLTLPPRVILPILLTLSMLLSCLIYGFGGLFFGASVLLVLHLLTLIIATPPMFFQAPYRKAWIQIGRIILNTLRAIIRSNKANRKFIHTPHGTIPKA